MSNSAFVNFQFTRIIKSIVHMALLVYKFSNASIALVDCFRTFHNYDIGVRKLTGTIIVNYAIINWLCGLCSNVGPDVLGSDKSNHNGKQLLGIIIYKTLTLP